jgi:hypothetical protein
MGFQEKNNHCSKDFATSSGEGIAAFLVEGRMFILC